MQRLPPGPGATADEGTRIAAGQHRHLGGVQTGQLRCRAVIGVPSVSCRFRSEIPYPSAGARIDPAANEKVLASR